MHTLYHHSNHELQIYHLPLLCLTHVKLFITSSGPHNSVRLAGEINHPHFKNDEMEEQELNTCVKIK